MKIAILSALLASVFPVAYGQSKASPSDIQRAIAFERHKDAASARQAKKEATQPSVRYDANRADREQGMPDPGEPQWQKHKEAEKQPTRR